jgi:hypothetical protein
MIASPEAKAWYIMSLKSAPQGGQAVRTFKGAPLDPVAVAMLVIQGTVRFAQVLSGYRQGANRKSLALLVSAGADEVTILGVASAPLARMVFYAV